MTLIVHAPNIRQGGGRTLLLSVLDALASRECMALLDPRLNVTSVPSSVVVKKVRPTIPGRLLAEWMLMRLTGPNDTVLCFGNLPPLLHNRGAVAVFLQNRYLFGDRDLSGFSASVRLRIRLERAWFATRVNARKMSIYVQTTSMAEELLHATGIKASVFPFAPGMTTTVSSKQDTLFDFIYVASGEPHKNHLQLIEAWTLLARQGLFPSLCLTLNATAHPRLILEIEKAKQDHGAQISNLGLVSSVEVERYYRRSGALIYPSTLESFGLPLIEASALGLPILASELDFVRDVASPVVSFDPYSALSIARAVKRFLHQGDEPQKIFSSADFIQEIERSLHPGREQSGPTT